MDRTRSDHYGAYVLIRRSILVLTVLTGTALWAAGPAQAATQQGVGENVTPAQPFLANPNLSDWLGSYLVAGSPVWAVDFGLTAPDSATALTPEGTLTPKWGTPVDTGVATQLSYLLWRYGSTTSADEAAALEHIVYRTMSAPQNPSQLSPVNDARHIAYDAPYHLNRLPASAQTAITTLADDATANAGNWTVTVTAPGSPQTIGTPAGWQVAVTTGGHAVPTVPVTLTATDATLPNGKSTQTITTPADGPATVRVTATGKAPTVVATVDAPGAAPEELSTGVQNGSRVLRAATTPVTAKVASIAVPAPPTTTPTTPGGPSSTAPSTPATSPGSPHGGSTASLPTTGSDIVLPLIIGLVAVVLGGGLLVVSRQSHRRR